MTELVFLGKRAAARWLRGLVIIPWLVACNGEELEDPGAPPSLRDGPPADEKPMTPGESVELEAPSEAQAEFETLRAALDGARQMDSAELHSSYPTSSEVLNYSAADAQHLDLIQSSALALDADELAMLGGNGFVISARQEFPSFSYGYQTLYMSDLPLFISADSLLDAVHRSYDEMLKSAEAGWLMGELAQQLKDLRGALPALPADDTVKADLDLYLGIALSLLEDKAATPVAGADSKTLSSFVDLARAASGTKEVMLFDVKRDVDFSQFTPRGHYTDSEELSRYFRAMMWLGRVDFRMIETQSDGSQVFHRRQFDAVLALGQLFEQTGFDRFQGIDSVIRAFVGESDYMTVPEIGALITDLGGAAAAATASDKTVAQTILDKGYGAQAIASHLIINDSEGTLPLNRSFAVFGQRYVLDSHVFSNVVWARTKEKRMMPNPLDVAFAALGNNAALPLLDGELEDYQYAGNLAAVRLLADEHDATFWGANLYNLWLDGLRALSAPAGETAPAIARTEPWARRILNTQLASWAELRHDTILYAKQSYTDGDSCEFPDAFVDPYPEFYAALQRFAEYGQTAIAPLVAQATQAHYGMTETGEFESVPLGQAITDYFTTLHGVAGMLKEMAEYQTQGTPFTAEHMAFINRAISVSSTGCGGPPYYPTGWYADLFFQAAGAADFDPTIADVHTQPTDEGGAPVGKVLHVGTGRARLMIVTADTCEGPKAYAGLASSYYEHITEDFERLTDADWSTMLDSGPQDLVPWQRDIVLE